MAIQPPITHYKDEPTDSDVQNVIDQELDKEVSEAKQAEAPQKPVELKVLPVNKQEKKPTNAANIVNAFRQKMSTNATPIELPSAGKTVEFKEISTQDQKDMSKIAMESDSRADIMYCAMLTMINKLATEKGFDIRDYSEFERIVVTLNLQQMNKINPEIKYTCSKCERENSYRLDVPALLRKFNKTYRPDQDVVIEHGNKKFTFTIGWNDVRHVEEFFKHYYRRYDNASKSVKETINNMSQIEYILMFVKAVTVEEINDPEDKMTADLNALTYGERVQIIDCLPQSTLFDEENGIVSKIISTYVDTMNKCFQYNDCAYCGAEQTSGVANVTDFMGL